MIAELYGKATGCSGGIGGSMHLIDQAVGFVGTAPIVASTVPIAVGLAFARQMQGSDAVAVAYLGDATIEEGVVYESLNFAALKSLPVVFVCENNLYSVYSPMSVRQPPDRQIADVASAIGVESHQGDGNDVEAVHALAGQAVAKARRGEGPTFLELMTYRWREHVGPNFDNDLGYRTLQEYDEWRARCPVETQESRLLDGGTATREELDAMRVRVRAEVDEAVAQAKADPFPDPPSFFEHVYSA
jgi:pyruvate dehydrogenase E1 component alpha subunit